MFGWQKWSALTVIWMSLLSSKDDQKECSLDCLPKTLQNTVTELRLLQEINLSERRLQLWWCCGGARAYNRRLAACNSNHGNRNHARTVSAAACNSNHGNGNHARTVSAAACNRGPGSGGKIYSRRTQTSKQLCLETKLLLLPPQPE